MRDYNVHEAFAILQKYYITDSMQMVPRWIREGKILGTRSQNRKEGYRIAEEDLYDFIEEQRPGLSAIMEVYDGYVKGLKLDLNEDNPSKELPPKDKMEENVTDELLLRIGDLEDKLTNLEQEKHQLETKIIELMEENDTFAKLYDYVEEENKQLKIIAKQSKTVKKKEEKTVKEKISPITLEDFKNIGHDMVVKLEIKLDETAVADHLRSIYEQVFEAGLIKTDLVDEEGAFCCPYSEKRFKQQKRFIKQVIKNYFDSIDNQKLKLEQLELPMANG